MKKLYTIALACLISSAAYAQTSLFGTNADANQWFWYNNQETSDLYVGNSASTKVIKYYDSSSSPTSLSSLDVTKQGAGTDGTAGTAGFYTGAIILAKTATKFEYTGGYAQFELPNCSEFQLTLSATGDICVGVNTSTNGTDWTVVSAPTAKISSKGINTYNISSFTTSSSKIWVKVINGGTGGLNVHGCKITVSDTPTKIQNPSLGTVVSTEFFSLTGTLVGTKYADLKPGIYLQKSTFDTGKTTTVKISKARQ
jgi:hypothetical protein